MTLNGKWIWAAGALAIAIAGASLGHVARSRYDANRGYPEIDRMYANIPAAARDDGSRVMGGKSPGDYFGYVLEILKEQFVDPIGDETPLAHGAARFMLQSLRDPGVRFYTPEEWKRYLDEIDGKYVGLGADLTIFWHGEDAQLQLPLTIVSVYDGGPAAAAGLQAGDVIEEVGGKWVASRSLLQELGLASDKRQRGEITEEEYQQEFERLREKSLDAIPINKALEKFATSGGSPFRVTVMRGSAPFETEVQLRSGQFDPIEFHDGTIRIRSFGRDVDTRLADLLPSSGDVTIDIRNNSGGSFEVMQRCLAQLLPDGEYGQLQTKKDKNPTPLLVSSGTNVQRKITILVDAGTAREAEVFAAALRDGADAQVVGAPTAGLGILCDRYTLADGSGYTLTRGHFVDLKGQSLYADRSRRTDSAAAREALIDANAGGVR